MNWSNWNAPTEGHLYIVHTDRAKKLWFPPNWWKRFPPRLAQIGKTLWCFMVGHDWSLWMTDDEGGPCEVVGFEDGEPVEMPLLARPCEPGESGHRGCLSCGLIQRRFACADLDPDGFWPKGDLVAMEE